jgi:hypothetical protein
MMQSRLLILLSGCLLAASVAWADDVGYIDCRNYPENTQVLAKTARTAEVVTSLPCGERFTILLRSFFFSRIQTKDGKAGYVFSYMVSRDYSATTVRGSPSAQVPAPTPNVPATSAALVEPGPTTPAQPQPTPAQPIPAQVPAPTPNVPATSAAVVESEPITPAQPQPAPAQPIEQTPRDARVEPGFGRPIPSVRRQPMVELFGGYAYVRFKSGGYINGGLGSFGWNVTPWLQIVTDTSYSLAMPTGAKNVLYAGHGGPRFFYPGRNRWGASPFVEALFGLSRLDTTISGPPAYQTSVSGFSIKAGGGLDLNLSPHFAIRLFDVDYYRTPFIANSHDNLWAFAGIVVRLGGWRPQ